MIVGFLFRLFLGFICESVNQTDKGRHMLTYTRHLLSSECYSVVTRDIRLKWSSQRDHTHTPVAERLAVDLSLCVLMTRLLQPVIKQP